MSGTVTVDTGGADSLAGSLTDVADAIRDPGSLVADVAAQVAAMAAAHTPRATGALAASGSVSPGMVGGRPAQLLTWGARYAVFVNFGTTTMAARPFATDALTAATQNAEPILTTWAEQALSKAHT